jgi:hypothetical protein
MLIERCFSITLKSTVIRSDLSFTLVHTDFGQPLILSAFTHFRLSEPLTPLRGTQFEKHRLLAAEGGVWLQFGVHNFRIILWDVNC